VTPIPCRPEAVNISNVAALVDSEGKPHFKYIVEGANLFFTQQARFYLEKRKVVLFKDSSANKGLFCFWPFGVDRRPEYQYCVQVA
jgi:glutamate dehydrogenase